MGVGQYTRGAPGPGGVGPAWRAGAALVVLGVLVPIVSLLWIAFGSGLGHWAHLVEHVLPAAVRNTLVLLCGVGLWATVVGTGSAWLVTHCDFPFRRTLAWALLLPLAMPTYIVAFVYLDMLHPIGAVQGAIRWMLGYDSPRQFRLPDLRSMGGAVFVLGSVLYPYVYLTMRALFLSQSRQLLESARLLGETRWGAFRRVAWPLARPALAVGLSLALLETLNDIGASEFLGIQTLTVTVYTTWVSRSDLAGAAQIACAMLLVVVAVMTLETLGRRRQRYSGPKQLGTIAPVPLDGARGWLATGLAALPVLVGFVAPATYLLVEASRRLLTDQPLSTGLLSSAVNTVGLALGVTALVLVAGLVVAWADRRVRVSSDGHGWLSRLASMGYAVPGTVVAIGLLPPALAADAALADAFGWPGLPLMGIGAVLVAACVVRFLSMAVGGIGAGLSRIPPQLEHAARLLGEGEGGTLRRVHLPLLRPSLAAAAMLVFVDAMKELPATLLLRPVNFDTLATLLYGEAARGTYEEGALAALAIVAAGLLPVAWLARTQTARVDNVPTAP